jgi:Tfp pilus assembly protein PilO
MRSNTWPRKQQLWVLGIGVLFVADFVLCGYWPSHNRLAALKEKKAYCEQTIQIGHAKALQLGAFRNRLSDTDEVVGRYDAYAPAEGSLGTFLRQVSEVMTKHQLSDQVVVAGKETQAEELVCIPVHITGEGALADVFGFFKDMRTMDRLVRIDRTTLRNDNTYAGRIAMDAEVIIFYRLDKVRTDGTAPGGRPAGGSNHGV